MRNPWTILFSLLFVAVLIAGGCGSDDEKASTDGDEDSRVDGDNLNPPDGDQDNSDVDGDSESDGDFEEPPFDPPACGTALYTNHHLIPGPTEAGYNAELALKATRYERQFHLFNAYPMATDASASVSIDSTDTRDLITRFLQEDDSWDFEAYAGKNQLEVIESWSKVAGLYGGMGIVADALRYGTLRDQGAACEDVDRARDFLLASLDALHMAHTIGGVPGVVVRGFIRKDLPGEGQSTVQSVVPLFDDQGNPLPEVKNNGTWREDNSGLYPDYLFEDSCSRDMMLGWAAASAVCMEVIRRDPTFSEDLKTRLKEDARIVGESLRTVRESDHDLELPDADGRITYHGYLNEECVERELYLDGFKNGFYSLMALGIVSAYAYASDDPGAWQYLNDELIDARSLPDIAKDNMIYINMGLESNWSNYNMAFISGWLAMRYVRHAEARDKIREAIDVQLYDTPDAVQQPVGAKMSLFDFIFAAAKMDESSYWSPSVQPDAQAVADGIETLKEFDTPPYWDYEVIQCDEAELESGQCELEDGTEVTVYDEGGRKGSTVCDQPIPKRMRRPSNFEWRSNPYNPNGGGNGSNLLSGVDFRCAYWIGRWTQIP